MKKHSIEMGTYYNAAPYGLIRTVCKAYDYQSGDAMIAYVNVSNGGIAGDVFLMPENEFKNIFIG